MRVKVCGITDPADAVLAAELGASAIGLVFWPSSPRSVSVERARHIVSVLPPFVSTVGVFVDQIEDARAIAADVRRRLDPTLRLRDCQTCVRRSGRHDRFDRYGHTGDESEPEHRHRRPGQSEFNRWLRDSAVL